MSCLPNLSHVPGIDMFKMRDSVGLLEGKHPGVGNQTSGPPKGSEELRNAVEVTQ